MNHHRQYGQIRAAYAMAGHLEARPQLPLTRASDATASTAASRRRVSP